MYPYPSWHCEGVETSGYACLMDRERTTSRIAFIECKLFIYLSTIGNNGLLKKHMCLTMGPSVHS